MCVCQEVMGSHWLFRRGPLYGALRSMQVHGWACACALHLSVWLLCSLRLREKKKHLTCCNPFLAFNRSLTCLAVSNRHCHVKSCTHAHTSLALWCTALTDGMACEQQQHDIQQNIIHMKCISACDDKHYVLRFQNNLSSCLLDKITDDVIAVGSLSTHPNSQYTKSNHL